MNPTQGNVDNDSVAAARQRFWATYPDAAGHEEARKRFAEALYQKDLRNLFLFSYPNEKLQARYVEANREFRSEHLSALSPSEIARDRKVRPVRLDSVRDPCDLPSTTLRLLIRL
jgi:hypothetical protein